MTITETDIQTYQSSVSDFLPQINADGCYPSAIKNILDELANRNDIPEMKLSRSDINDLCNYREGMYTQEEIIPGALSHEIADFGYQAAEASAPKMDYSELDEILSDEDSSLPIVELDPTYFEQVENYRTQGRQEASHTVIVFKINSEKVLYYDPYEKFFEKSSGVDKAPYEQSKTDFYELWSGDYEERWTFWLERREQSLLDEFRNQ
jgi:hypothetical protein